MNKTLKLINSRTLSILDERGQILARHTSLWTKFEEYKRVKENCNIIKESSKGFPKENIRKANIYCLDDQFNIRWIIDPPFENDTFPNPICWNKLIIRKQKPEGNLTLEWEDNTETFTCSSLKGFTVSIEYETGQTKSIEFTK